MHLIVLVVKISAILEWEVDMGICSKMEQFFVCVEKVVVIMGDHKS